MDDSPQQNPQAPAAPQAGAPGAARTARTAASRLPGPALWIAVLALALAAWIWYDGRGETAALRQEVAKRLADADSQARESRIIAEQAREALAQVQVKIGVLEGRLAESQSQQIALEALYQELSRNRDEWALSEIEQSLFIASQQLQLAGNVKAALIALQAADARLQLMDRPQLAALRKAITRDIERLRALPYLDTVAISVRLDALASAVDGLPLAMEERPQPGPPPAQKDAAGGLWARFWREALAEVKQLVRVQRIDRPDVALLAPSQTFFLRENLKLRLISARLALLARDSASYKADLKAARDWLDRFYDSRNAAVARAAATLRNLHEAEVSIETPEIGATLEALRKVRIVRGR